jgi:hypothetical protein
MSSRHPETEAAVASGPATRYRELLQRTDRGRRSEGWTVPAHWLMQYTALRLLIGYKLKKNFNPLLITS